MKKLILQWKCTNYVLKFSTHPITAHIINVVSKNRQGEHLIDESGNSGFNKKYFGHFL